jgi:hypothetical protein
MPGFTFESIHARLFGFNAQLENL